MQEMAIDGDIQQAIVGDLAQSGMFSGFSEDALNTIAGSAVMVQCDPKEVVTNEGDNSDSFFLIMSGEAIIKVPAEGGELTEIARVQPFDTVGELGLLLEQPRSATVVAGDDTVLLKFNADTFAELFVEVPGFGVVVSRVLAKRLSQSSRSIVPSLKTPDDVKQDPSAKGLLPTDFVQRHHVLPLKVEGNILQLGFVNDPTPDVLNAARQVLPGMELRPVAISKADFDAVMKSTAGKTAWATPGDKKERKKIDIHKSKTPKLDELLQRMVAEGASDVHLSAGHKPRWRIDGNIMEMEDTEMLGADDVHDLIVPMMAERNKYEFKETNDTDFAHEIRNVARFRVNMFRDKHGVGAVLRQIPEKIMTIEQLGLPEAITNLCDYPKGLILVTGPTGSGKSTTLAAMIDHVNKTREAHIITLEDPIEFVHESQKCLVNQREVGPHTDSFSRALRAALREDPDIVLVGEMRDLETVSLALETANTGHLVFGTLHTNTAVSTIARIIDMFPGEQQGQVQSVLADNLKGVISQTLCRRTGGGRVAALEIMVTDTGMASLMRDGKTHQIVSAMQTGKSRGNRVLNEELLQLAAEDIISKDEALSKSVDKADLAGKLGVQADGA
ncbi:PilT/PilU family type 4a pilus ATPase [Verrucomicrobiota bacterium]